MTSHDNNNSNDDDDDKNDIHEETGAMLMTVKKKICNPRQSFADGAHDVAECFIVQWSCPTSTNSLTHTHSKQ
jgi:hypothetical protein